LKGRAELIRHLFVLANQPFEDHRVEFSEWGALKNTLIFKQLPILGNFSIYWAILKNIGLTVSFFI
jgi:hypothetical protein